MIKTTILIVAIIFCVPMIAYLIGRYGTVGYYSAKEFLKNQSKKNKY